MLWVHTGGVSIPDGKWSEKAARRERCLGHIVKDKQGSVREAGKKSRRLSEVQHV